MLLESYSWHYNSNPGVYGLWLRITLCNLLWQWWFINWTPACLGSTCASTGVIGYRLTGTSSWGAILHMEDTKMKDYLAGVKGQASGERIYFSTKKLSSSKLKVSTLQQPQVLLTGELGGLRGWLKGFRGLGELTGEPTGGVELREWSVLKKINKGCSL